MFSPDHLNPIIRDIMSKLTGQSTYCNPKNDMKSNSNNSSKKQCGMNITPSQALVIAGIIGGALDVTSIVIGKDQLVEIVLSGSLKKKTELEKMIDQIGAMPFEEVMKAVMDKLS